MAETAPREIVIVTSAFHVTRTRFIFDAIFGRTMTVLGARNGTFGEELAAAVAHEQRALHSLQANRLTLPRQSQ